MRKLLSAATLSAALTAAGATYAGNIAPPPSDPQVIVADTQSSSGHILVPLLALIFMVAGVSS